LDKLANWPLIVTQFRELLNKSKKTFQLPPQTLPTPFRLLRLIARNNTNKNYNAIEANFLYAAMHLACMKELRFQRGMCPDLLESIDALVCP
jgi:hypothetical protein